MIEKTINFVLGEKKFRTLVTSRTDAKVSANHSVFELFVEEPIDQDSFLDLFNENIPPDIRALKVEQTDAAFNIIQSPKSKHYQYFFSFGQKPHPFSASIISHFIDHLDIEIMQEGARLFEGKHNFFHYCKAPKEGTVFEREIEYSFITKNNIYSANFFPEETYMYEVCSKGFMRNQIRYMMGQLIDLGQGKTSLEKISESLANPDIIFKKSLAPASGLVLNKVSFEKSPS